MPQQPGNAAQPAVIGVDLSGGRLAILQERREVISQQYQATMAERGRIGQERLNAQARGDASMVKEYDATIERLGGRLQQLERSLQIADGKIDEAMQAPLAIGASEAPAPGDPVAIELTQSLASQLDIALSRQKTLMVYSWAGLVLLAGVLWRVGYLRGWRAGQREQQTAVTAPRDDERLMQAVDAIAIEVERLSEGQRFLSNLMAARRPERSELPAPPRLATTPSEGSRITPH